jgi:homoserine kinase
MVPFTVRVPATTANLGPGFDVLALALDLWNEVEVEARPEAGLSCHVVGFGEEGLPRDGGNAVLKAANQLFEIHGSPAYGLHFICRNKIPPGSGLGSSSAAILSGLLAANQVLDGPAEENEILDLAARLEGHPDNVTAALLGGLIVSASLGNAVVTRKRETAPWWAAVVVPNIEVLTTTMRAALPAQVPHADAVFNLSRTVLVMEALISGDLPLLRRVMEDRLHQPYRMPLIPGTQAALAAALEGGGASALSGAGPGVIAFAYSQTAAGELAGAMASAFSQNGIESWSWVGKVSDQGGYVTPLSS